MLNRGQSEFRTDDSIAVLQGKLEVEERIVEAARRMTEIPARNKKERQRRKITLQE